METENDALMGAKFEEWQKARESILGTRTTPPGSEPSPPGNLPGTGTTDINKDRLDTFYTKVHEIFADFDDSVGNLQHAWNMAPQLDQLLDTLADEMDAFASTAPEIIDEVLSASQKNTMKTQYLRGFGTLLSTRHGIDLTLTVRKAVAEFATVLLDDPDDIVELVTVNNALRDLLVHED